jgi:hypothetical protein
VVRRGQRHAVNQHDGANGRRAVEESEEAAALHAHRLWLTRGLSVDDMRV